MCHEDYLRSHYQWPEKVVLGTLLSLNSARFWNIWDFLNDWNLITQINLWNFLLFTLDFRSDSWEQLNAVFPIHRLFESWIIEIVRLWMSDSSIDFFSKGFFVIGWITFLAAVWFWKIKKIRWPLKLCTCAQHLLVWV